ncbi:N-acetylmuramoyl-L-alanine amidase [Aedoeadaptatus coxii]|uniref:N-acetylmuramoyl-L-alanine amidase n=1 Tax=Aedoeadaptatus coxii TaxID=755172 RepID=A0A134ABF8_9FIRM|nr:N-acetylmuramoyl-L-alanine amidase [Peptoniphilus coxii]KXB64998.1 N-acetylmuramoyl-L-alanine amidase [Peptoniphilus coxii]
MKRLFKTLALSMAMMMSLSSYAMAKGSNVQIKVKGARKNVATANVVVNGYNLKSRYAPYVDGNRTFVPIRELTELMGADVQWDQGTKSVRIRLRNQDVKLKINSSVVYVNNKKMQMDKQSTPRLTQYVRQNGDYKTMVPLRFLSENLGFNVQWNNAARQASVSNGSVQAPQKRVNQNNKPAVPPKPQVKKPNTVPANKPSVAVQDKGSNQIEVPRRVEKPKNGKPTVVIDPGHGGKDSGAIGVDRSMEKTWALKTAQRVEGLLRQQGYQVIMTRTRDEYIQLAERARIANDANADIFLSIHFNSGGSEKPRGVEVLYASENNVSLKKQAGDQRRLANEVLKSVLKETGMSSRGIKNRPELAVLRLTKMNAALVEGGFMSNPDEMDIIKSDAYLDKLARGIVNGIVNFDQKYL